MVSDGVSNGSTGICSFVVELILRSGLKDLTSVMSQSPATMNSRQDLDQTAFGNGKAGKALCAPCTRHATIN